MIFIVNMDGKTKCFNYALDFLIVAIVAAVFGFTDIVTADAGVAKIIFYVFLILSALLFLFSINQRTRI
ncbi:MAG: DUF1328 domain-containing protein [Desulfobacterales bacterium]